MTSMFCSSLHHLHPSPASCPSWRGVQRRGHLTQTWSVHRVIRLLHPYLHSPILLRHDASEVVLVLCITRVRHKNALHISRTAFLRGWGNFQLPKNYSWKNWKKRVFYLCFDIALFIVSIALSITPIVCLLFLTDLSSRTIGVW